MTKITAVIKSQAALKGEKEEKISLKVFSVL